MKKVYSVCTVLIYLLITISCKKTKEKKNSIEKKAFTFNYMPQKPIDGKSIGVVELGASGFNSFIINIDKNLNWELKAKEYGISLIVEGMTNTHLVNEKLREYIDKITTYGITKKDIHFIVSSGAVKEKITQIIIQELEKLGHTVNNLTVQQEGKYALQSVLPKKYSDNSFLVDIGSGNTKISYFTSSGDAITLETHGAKYYQKGIESDDVFKNVRKIVAKIPLKNREHCFIIGGIPTKLARSISPKEELYTVLSPDVKKFEKIISKEGKKLESGINIYNAIQKGTNVSKIIYVLDGNFSTGFLLEKAQ